MINQLFVRGGGENKSKQELKMRKQNNRKISIMKRMLE